MYAPLMPERVEHRRSQPLLEVPGARGVNYDSARENARSVFLIESNSAAQSPLAADVHVSESVRRQLVIQDTAELQSNPKSKLLGHLKIYDRLLPENVNILEVPVIEAWLHNLELLVAELKKADILQGRGGSHVGPKVLKFIKRVDSAAEYGGYHDTADEILATMILAALLEPRIKIDMTCRGHEALLALLSQLPPDNLEGHAPALGMSEMVIHPVKNIFSELYKVACPVDLPTLTQVNSYHSQGYQLAQFSPELLAQLAAQHWFITHVSPNGIIEMLIRLDATHTRVTGISRQFHIERLETAEAAAFRSWNQQVMSQICL